MHEWRATHAPRVVALAQVQRRLELLLAAMYGRSLRVVPAVSVVPVVGAARGDIALPTQLGARDGVDDAHARYRLLAISQGARVVRGTHERARGSDSLAHDLYLLAETAAVERDIVARAPGLAPTLAALRRAELEARPRRDRLNAVERPVEYLLRDLLGSSADSIPASLPASDGPDASRAWAVNAAAAIRRAADKPASAYRSIRIASLWGIAWSPDNDDARLTGSSAGLDHSAQVEGKSDETTPKAARESKSGSKGTEADDEAEARESADTQPSERGPSSRSADDVTDDATDVTASARPEATAERRHADDVPPPNGVHYPEWDTYAHRLRPDGATVSLTVAEGTDDRWADDVLREHASLVRQVRDRFAPLRARRLRLRRQRSGDELDLEACIDAVTDRLMGRAPSDRLYEVARPARHTLAIMLLVDVSGSTKERLPDGRTVLDVERMTLLLAGEALATLGDPFAMLAFSGCGAHGVRVQTVKSFDEHDESVVRRRISALVPRDYTRLGAAVRHATTVLLRQPAQRHILLIVSDGKPNDVYGYQGDYAIDDSRHAVLGARTSGVHPFCLTVDQEERDYLPHLFGPSGYRVLHRPEQLPEALLRVVDRMLRE